MQEREKHETGAVGDEAIIVPRPQSVKRINFWQLSSSRFDNSAPGEESIPALIPLSPNADHTHHPSCMASRGSMREEQIRMAAGASTCNADRRSFQACIEKLATIRFDEIEMHRGPNRRVPRSTLRQKEHRVLRAHRIGIKHLAKQLARIAELRFKLRAHLFSNPVATLANSGTDRRDQVLRLATEFKPHSTHSQFHDPLDGPPPTRMKATHHSAPLIGNKDRDAVSGLDGNQQSGSCRDRSIRLSRTFPAGVLWGRNNHQVRVKLAQRHNGCGSVSSHRFCKQSPILNDRLSRIRFGEPKIQFPRIILAAIGPTHTA